MAAGNESTIARFAAETLDIEPGSTPDEPRATLLRLLHDNDFLLDPVSHDAVKVLSGQPLSLAPRLAEAAARDEESRLRRKIEAFATDYFEIPVGERRERWLALQDACSSHEFLLERLRWLGRGLDIDREAFRHESPLVDRLVSNVFVLYTLPTHPHAARRRDLAESVRSDPAVKKSNLKRALKTIRTSYPLVTSLGSSFLADLERPSPGRLKFRLARVPVTLTNKVNGNPLQSIALWICCAGAFIRVTHAFFATPWNHSPPPFAPIVAPAPFSIPPEFLKNGIAADAKRRADEERANLRRQLREAIRQELATLDRKMSEEWLEPILDIFFARTVLRKGLNLDDQDSFTEEDHAHLVSGLKTALTDSGIELDTALINAVARNAVPKPAESPRVTKTRSSSAFVRAFRELFKAPIRRELAMYGKMIDEARLQEIVDALPAENVPEAFGIASVFLMGYWTDAVYNRYVTTLKRELDRAGFELSGPQLDAIARHCFPRPGTSSPNTSPRSRDSDRPTQQVTP